MKSAGGGVPELVFRGLLRLYPRWFRHRYGEEMVLLFRSRLARTRGGRERIRFWWRTVADALVNGVAVREPVGGPLKRTYGPGERRALTLLTDLRHTVRRLRKAPAFTLGAVALLAVGIGANTTVFTIVDRLLFRPPPWEDPDEVVFVYQDSDDGEPSSSSYPATRDMARSRAFQAVAAISQSSVTWESADGPVPLSVEYATASYMDVLGLSVQRGRWFDAAHDAVGSEPVAVVSAPAWRSRFGGDPDVVGRSLRLNGRTVTVIGVGPERLNGTYSPAITDLWLSISATPVGGDVRVANLDRRQDHWYDVRARLAPGVTVAQAQAEMDGLAASLAEEYPALNRGRDITVFSSSDVRLHPQGDAELRQAAGLLTAVALTVLLLACANLANLLLVRGLGRTGEMAIRRALGAGRAGVAGLFLMESLLLALVGGALGVLLSRWALAALPSMPIPLPESGIDLALDARVGLASLTLVLATGVLFGLAPALRSSRSDMASTLRDERPSSTGGRGSARLRGVLVAVQVAASLVLVLATGVLGRSLAAMQSVDTGVDADRVAWVRTDFARAGLDGEAAYQALDEVLARVRAIPGVTAAGATTRLPASFGASTTTVVEDYRPASGTDAIELDFAVITDGYFEALGVPLLEGRVFGDEDASGAPTAVLVNETAARRWWGGAPLGRRLFRQDDPSVWRTVVGVVGDVPVRRVSEPARPFMYFRDRQAGLAPSILVARTDGPPEAINGALRAEVQAVRSSLTVTSQGTLAAHFGSALEGPRFAALVLGAFSLLAVVLAGLGIYAVVSYGVARRTAELGIRMALGAGRGRVIRMVVREVVGMVALGLGVGLALAFFAGTRLEGALFGVRTLDPATFAVAVAFLLAVAATAAWLPARRAALADPASALRVS